MTIEEKARAYDEAIERANAAYKDEDRHLKATLERIFPELKEESEDEKIRELLINLANQTWDGASCFKDFSKEKILAWLEKQGNLTDINPSEFDLRLNKLLKQFETLPKEELASSLSFYLNVVQNDGTYKDKEKQKEQKPVDKIQLGKKYKCIASPRYSTFMVGEIYEPKDKFLCSLMNFCSDCFESIEDKEQKSSDKVEPKFKVGDWVIDKQDIVHQIANVIENVTNHTYGYDIVGGDYFNDNTEGVRLWTIQDAKDGDVLCYETENELRIFIYKNGHIHYHCHYCDGHLTTVDSFFIVEKYLLCYIHPSTEEQRDTLMKAMADAGYTFDFEKKELKKIEQKPAELSQLEVTKTSDQVWSEEDETGLTNTIIMLKEGASLHFNKKDITKTVDWLKSFKDRVQPQNIWKPNNEQMKILLSEVEAWTKGCPKQKVLESLYNDLKKLK